MDSDTTITAEVDGLVAALIAALDVPRGRRADRAHDVLGALKALAAAGANAHTLRVAAQVIRNIAEGGQE